MNPPDAVRLEGLVPPVAPPRRAGGQAGGSRRPWRGSRRTELPGQAEGLAMGGLCRFGRLPCSGFSSGFSPPVSPLSPPVSPPFSTQGLDVALLPGNELWPFSPLSPPLRSGGSIYANRNHVAPHAPHCHYLCFPHTRTSSPFFCGLSGLNEMVSLAVKGVTISPPGEMAGLSGLNEGASGLNWSTGQRNGPRSRLRGPR